MKTKYVRLKPKKKSRSAGEIQHEIIRYYYLPSVKLVVSAADVYDLDFFEKGLPTCHYEQVYRYNVKNNKDKLERLNFGVVDSTGRFSICPVDGSDLSKLNFLNPEDYLKVVARRTWALIFNPSKINSGADGTVIKTFRRLPKAYLKQFNDF